MKYWLLFLLIPSLAIPCGDHNSPMNCPRTYGQEYSTSQKSKNEAYQYEVDMHFGRLKERTYLALDAIVRYAAFRMKLKGAEGKSQAKILIEEWENRFTWSYDLGDHEPLSKWLAEKYLTIEFILGTQACKTFRLNDIKTINYGIPVVFKCVDNVDEPEYFLHLQPFLGVVGYWSSFFTCVGFTWGTGAFYCGPVSLGVEFLSEVVLAPRINDPLWNAACKKGVL